MVSGTDRRPLAGRRAYLLPLVFASAGFLSLLLINVFLEPFHSPTSHSLPLDDPLLEYARKLSRSIDPHTSPCTDFYQYACGNWASQFSLTDQVEHLDYGILLTRQTNRQLRERFKTVGENLEKTDSRVVKYVVQLYGECIDEKQRSKLGVRPVAEQVRKLVGEWPILVERDTVKTLSDPRWMDLLVDFFLVDIHPVVAITFELNALDAHEKILKISKPDVLPFGLPKKYNENNLRDRFFQAVKQLMGRVFPYSEQQRTQVETAIHEMIAFELKLANYSGKSQTHMMSLGLLKRRTGHLMDWTQLLNRFAAKAQATVRFTDQSKVVVRDLPYLHHLGTVLSVTPLRTVKHFLAWILVYQHQYLLDSETRQGWPNGGQDSSRNLPTWKACLNLLHKSNLFTLAISQLYLRQQNGNQTDLWRIKETVSGIIDHLVVAYEATFHQSNSGIWLDTETARRALVKLRAHGVRFLQF